MSLEAQKELLCLQITFRCFPTDLQYFSVCGCVRVRVDMFEYAAGMIYMCMYGILAIYFCLEWYDVVRGVYCQYSQS